MRPHLTTGLCPSRSAHGDADAGRHSLNARCKCSIFRIPAPRNTSRRNFTEGRCLRVALRYARSRSLRSQCQDWPGRDDLHSRDCLLRLSIYPENDTKESHVVSHVNRSTSPPGCLIALSSFQPRLAPSSMAPRKSSSSSAASAGSRTVCSTRWRSSGCWR